MANKKLPIYKLEILPKEGSKVFGIAYVQDGAVEEDFLMFDTDKVEEYFSNDDEMTTLGVALIPDKHIFRRNKKTQEEYYVYFTKEEVEKITMQFMQDGYQSNLNLNHTSNKANSFIYQIFIIDRKKGINVPFGLNQKLPDGTLVIGTKVLDKKLWQDIKDGKYKAFSIEGLFEQIEESFNTHNNEADEIIQMMNQLSQLINKLK